MSDEIYEHFDRTITQAKNDWERNFVLPYGNAYVEAQKSFLEKIGAQKQADEAARKRIAELAMTALTFCGGKLLTVVFASSALKVAAAEITVGVLETHNMQRALSALNYLKDNKTAHFALGKAWDKGKDILSTKTKKLFEETSENFPSLSEFAQHPQVMQNHLLKWVLDLYAKVLKAETDIKDQSARAAAVDALLDSPFVKTAPENSLGTSRTADDVELSFYMKMLLDLDTLAVGHYTTSHFKGNSWQRAHVGSRKPISESPSSSSYPTGKESGKNFESVEYGRVGSILRGQIDALSKKRFSARFFLPEEHISRSTLTRAESKLVALANVNGNVCTIGSLCSRVECRATSTP